VAIYRGHVIAFRERLKATLGALVPPRKQNWLAEQSGIAPSTISRILAGDRNPTPEVIESLAPVLGMEPHQLVRGTDAEEAYVKSGEFVKRSMYDAVVGKLAEYEARNNDLTAKLHVANEARAKNQTELGGLHQELARVSHDCERVREDNRLLRDSNRDYRGALTRAVTQIANLQAKLKILGEELGTTKQSSRTAAILAGVAAFTGVVTLASLLHNDGDASDESTNGEDEHDE
jgi:transcriptional regulator with XRE-family HTH domain